MSLLHSRKPAKASLGLQHSLRMTLVSRVIEELAQEDGEKRLIVVEGYKDRAALLKLGVKTNIMTLRLFLRLASTDLLEKMNVAEVIVLTDFDKAGKFHSRTIRKICSGRVKVNTEYKGRLKKALGGWAKEVEGIPQLIEHCLVK